MLCSLTNPLEESHQGAQLVREERSFCVAASDAERRFVPVTKVTRHWVAGTCYSDFHPGLLAPARRSKLCVCPAPAPVANWSSSVTRRSEPTCWKVGQATPPSPTFAPSHASSLERPVWRAAGHARAMHGPCTVIGSRHGLPSGADTVKDSVTCQVHHQNDEHSCNCNRFCNSDASTRVFYR